MRRLFVALDKLDGASAWIAAVEFSADFPTGRRYYGPLSKLGKSALHGLVTGAEVIVHGDVLSRLNDEMISLGHQLNLASIARGVADTEKMARDKLSWSGGSIEMLAQRLNQWAGPRSGQIGLKGRAGILARVYLKLAGLPQPPTIFRVALALGVKRSTWRRDDQNYGEGSGRDCAFEAARVDLLLREAPGVCAACGFSTKVVPDRGMAGGFHAHHLNDNHRDSNLDNLALLCPFCHQYFHIGLAGAQGRGILALIPWVSPERLNLMAHLAHLATEAKDTAFAAAARRYQELAALGIDRARQEFGSDDPAVVGNLLLALQAEEYDRTRRKLVSRGLRLLPVLEASQFQQPIAQWNSHWARTFGGIANV